MFNLFKKNEDPLKESLGGFQNSFSKEQKSAIIGSLILLIKADNQAHPLEIKNLEQAERILGIGSDDPVHRKVAAGGYNEIIRILNTLNKDQKEWLVLAMHSMILADGKLKDIEIEDAVGIAEDIGISEDEFIEIIEKANATRKFFNL